MSRPIKEKAKELFAGSAKVRRFTYKIRATRGNCAHFAKFNHMLTADVAMGWGSCAHFSMDTDCFCRLSPTPSLL